MNLNWSNRVIKYVLFVFNLLFVISGIIMIAVGVSVKEYYSDYDIFLSGKYFSLPNLLIAIGSLIFFISFFGCCGAIRESWFMIFVFSILLAIIFILEFSAGIAGYVLRDDTAEYLKEELGKSMYRYQFDKSDHVSGQTIMWDAIQREFHCCGANGPKDWSNVATAKPPTETPDPTTPSTATTATTPTTTTTPTTAPNASTPSSITSSESSISTSSVTTTKTTESPTDVARKRRDLRAEERDPNALPFSCCSTKPGSSGLVSCNLNDTSKATYYKKGCVTGFGDFLKEHAVTIGGVGIAIALIQLFGVIFACHLTKQLKNGFYST